jgi:serine phosphatase RsbU (regulator of sigma subunit)
MRQSTRRFARRILLIHLLLLVALLAVVFFASWGIYRSARDQAFEQAQRQQSLLVNQTASGLKGYYDSIFSDLELFKPISPDDEDTEDRIPEEETGSAAVGTGKNLRGFRVAPMLPIQLNGRVAHLFLVEKGTLGIRPYGPQATIPSMHELVDRNRAWLNALDKATISPVQQFDDKQNNLVRSFTLIGVPVGPKKNFVLVASVSARATAKRYFEDVDRTSDGAAFLLDDTQTIIAASRPGLIGTRITRSSDSPAAATIMSLTERGGEATEPLNKSFTIGSEKFPPAMLTAQAVTVLDKQWTVLISSPLSDIDAVVRRLFGRAVFWALFVAVSMTAILVSTAVQLIRNRARFDRERHALLEKEIRQARDIQLAWLPQKRVRCSALDIATVNHPASRISGDFYNWFELPDGRTAVVIGDVTGHGMAAAFLMATTQLLVRNTLPQVIDPGRCMEEINRQLCMQVFNGQFVTLQILVLDPRNDRIEIATGGHPPPILGDADGFRRMALEPNLVLGVERDSTYGTEAFDVSPNSTIVLYTDGVLDAESLSGERYGLDRLRHALAAPADSAQMLIDSVLQNIDAFTGGRPFGDDLTLVAVQVQSHPTRERPREIRHPAAAPA